MIESTTVMAAQTPYHGTRIAIAVGNIVNRSSYQQGVFADSAVSNRLGDQTKQILSSFLQQSNRFKVLNRTDLDSLKGEAALANRTQTLKGADYMITGDVVEFGRKEQGDHQLFGVLGRGKTQVAYAKVIFNVVDVRTAEVLYTTQGTGEYTLSTREIVGFGNSSSYDATLNGKVLDLAVRDAINHLTQAMDNGSLSLK